MDYITEASIGNFHQKQKARNMSEDKKGVIIMKRVIAFLLVVVVMLSLCACKSSEQRELERAEQNVRDLEAQYEQAQENADNVRQDIEEYNRLIDALG